MRKTQFIARVLESRPNLDNVDTYFFVTPFDHVLSGFCAEMTPRGIYIWKFRYPLFDRYEGLSLVYSNRLAYPHGYVDYSSVPKESAVEVFLSTVGECWSEVYEHLSLDRFLAYLQGEQFSKNDFIKKAISCCHILLGNERAAADCLRQAKDSLTAQRNMSFDKECVDLIDALSSGGIEQARDLVMKWEAQMKTVLANLRRGG